MSSYLPTFRQSPVPADFIDPSLEPSWPSWPRLLSTAIPVLGSFFPINISLFQDSRAREKNSLTAPALLSERLEQAK